MSIQNGQGVTLEPPDEAVTLESLRMASVKETADIVGVSRTTVWNWIGSGKLKAHKVEGRRLIAVSDLRKFLGFDAKVSK
jgi:excisionase family DNA binding protein